jgi:hypothetical protein
MNNNFNSRSSLKKVEILRPIYLYFERSLVYAIHVSFVQRTQYGLTASNAKDWI